MFEIITEKSNLERFRILMRPGLMEQKKHNFLKSLRVDVVRIHVTSSDPKSSTEAVRPRR